MIDGFMEIFLGSAAKLSWTSEHSPINFDSDQSLGIYVHIPFCKKLCDFCPYFRVADKKALHKPFVDALLKEIQLKGQLFKGQYPNIKSVYFGGGSPALLAEYIPEILDAFRKYFCLSDSIAVELHPSQTSNRILSKLKESGVSMVSLGIQTFQPELLAYLGRPYEEMEKSLKRVAQAGFKTIDVDLMFGLYGQTPQMLKDDFSKAIELGATQISTYPFIDFSYAGSKIKPATSKVKKKLLRMLVSHSEKLNFVRDSVWTFKKNGTEKYSSVTRESFLGFGPSAATLTPKVFTLNTFSVEAYIQQLNQQGDPRALTFNFNEKQRQFYWLFWNLYKMELSDNDFRNQFGIGLDQRWPGILKGLVVLGLLKKDGSDYKLTNKGGQWFHVLEQQYTKRFIQKTWQEAMKTPWPIGFKM